MKPFKLSGTIALVNRRLFHKGKECLGLTKGCGRTFRIQLSKHNSKSSYEFIDTLLHELLHLWLFIVFGACGISLSEEAQHRIVDKTIPIAIKHLIQEMRIKK